MKLNKEQRAIIWDALYGRRCEIQRAVRNGDGKEIDEKIKKYTELLKMFND